LSYRGRSNLHDDFSWGARRKTGKAGQGGTESSHEDVIAGRPLDANTSFNSDSHKKSAKRTLNRVAVISAKNHKRQRRKRQSLTAKLEKSETPKVLTAILTLLNLIKLNLT